MSHWPEFLLVAKARRPEPAAGPVGSSPLHAASAAISSTDRAVLTPPPEGGSAQIGLAGACPKEGDASCGRPSCGSLLGNLTFRRSGMSEPSVRCVQRLQRNI